MSVLRRKYFSNQSQSFIDIPTDANQNFSSADIGSVYNNETIRLIKFGDDVDSSKLDQTFIDLLHNDKKLFDEYQKINSLISNGSFYNVGDNFEIFDVKKLELPEDIYIKSFGIKSGQIKYDDEIIFLEPTSFYTTAKTTVSGGNKIEVNSTIDLNVFANSVTEGSVVFGSEFQSGTQVVGITGTSLELSLNLKPDTTLASGSLILFMNIPTFEIGKEIQNIGNYSSYPVWRRDLISYDIKSSQWEVLKGIEIGTEPPINTQLDVIYQITNINYISGDIHQLKLKNNNRPFSSDFTVGDFIKLNKSDNKTFDGIFQIVSLDSANFTINIKIPLIRDNKIYGVISNIDDFNFGIIDLKKIGILSILVYKHEANAASLIVDNIQNITSISGITGGIQQILEAPINHYESYFSIKTHDRIHLIDGKGRLLDWEDGQGIITDPVVGYTYNEDENKDHYLVDYSETSIPIYSYANIEMGNLTNIPFILDEIENNVFGLKFIDITSFNIGVKNNSISIGQEGISFKITTYPQLSPTLSATTIDPSLIQNNQKITTITNINSGFDFRSYGAEVRPQGSDFILITSGKGFLQIGKIITIEKNYIQVAGLYKDIDVNSKFIIFKNEIQNIDGSETVIASDIIRSQVLSGINGTFGDQNSYSKVSLSYSIDEVIPKVESSKWYFLSLKTYNDISINPQFLGSPFIVTENINSTNSDASSSFVEVYYRTVTGKYPGGSFLIQDEFGDIGVLKNERSEAPHFRPVKYQVLARSLDEKLDYPQDVDEVFVDVHVGIFKFHPDAIPRRVFVSYNKYDVIDGNSTDFSIKHLDISNNTSKINLQDKIADLDYKFTQENEIQKTWKINGLISDENLGFCGPVTIDINDSYNIIYKDPNFTNFSFDEEKYIVKFSNHLYDTPIYVGKNNILLENISLEKDSSSSEDFTEGTLIENFSFLDYQTGVSAVTLPFIGINFFDESFVPTNDGFFSSVSDFYRKKLTFETPIERSEMIIDDGLYNLDLSVNSKWNYLYTAPFEKNMVLYALLRKNSYEFLSLINCNDEIKRRLKQREVIKILDKNLNDLNSNKSITKVVSEKYLSKSILLDSTKYKENLLYLKTEITKYKPYEFFNAQNLQNQSLELTDINYPLIGFNSTSIRRSSIYIDNSIITAFISPNVSRPKIKIIKFVKSEETSDIGNETEEQINEITVDDISSNDIRICRFNEKYFAVGYVSLITVPSGQNYYIKIKIYDLNGVEQPLSEQLISEGLPVASPFIFEIGDIGLNRIAIVFQRSVTEIALINYYYFYNTTPIQTDIKIIDSENTLSTYPSICKFSKDLFLVAYSNIFGSKIKIFNQDGKLQFFDDNSTLSTRIIDFRTITNNRIDITGNIIKAIELDNNDIAILYLDKALLEKFDLKLVILDSWTRNWKYAANEDNTTKTLPNPIFVEYNLTEKIESISMSVLNEDIFVVSYVRNGVIVLKAFFNDGAELFKSFEQNLTNGASLINLNTVGQSTLIATYMSGQNYKYSVYNFRPNFSRNIIQNQTIEIADYSSNNFIKNLLLDNNNYILIQQTNSTNYSFKVISTINNIQHELNTDYDQTTTLTLSGTNPKILDVFFINETNFKQIFILWSNSEKIFLEFFKIINSKINKSPQNQEISQTTHVYSKNFGKITQIQNNIVGVFLRHLNSYHIHGINFQVLRTLTSFDYGASDTNKYTSASNRYYSNSDNLLSGVNSDYDVSFYKRSGTAFGYLLNSSTVGTIINAVTLEPNLFSQNALNFSGLITNSIPFTINRNNLYQKINFSVDKFNQDKGYYVGNSSGSLHYYSVNFFDLSAVAEDNQNVSFSLTSSSGVYYTASGSNNLITGEPQIFNSSFDDGLILFYANTSGSQKFHNVSFINKNNNAIIDSSPKLIFNEALLGDEFYVQKTSDVDDFFVTYISKLKVCSKTLTLPFTDKLEYERVLEAKEKVTTVDPAFQNRNRLYLNNSIKIGGINWKGQIVKNYPVYSVDNFNLDFSQIDSNGLFKSQMLSIGAHLVSISKDSFIVLYYYQQDKLNELKLKLRNFVISRSKIFPDSDWYDANDLLSFEEISGSSRIYTDIYLQAIKYVNNILIVWVDPDTKKINKVLIDKENRTVGSTDTEIVQPNNSDWVLFGSSELIEGWSTVLGYEKVTNKFYTLLFNPNGDLHRLGRPFSITQFDVRTATTSRVSVNKFGYFSWLYIDSNSDLKYYQHGFDGEPWGIVQLVGKNYITNIQTSSNSPIYNEIREDILKTEEIKFLQYNRIDYIIENNNSTDIYDIFGSQETGLYRIFNINDPTLNIIMGIKTSQGEPIVSIDTSSSVVSNISNSPNKFNIYISPSTNYVTFQNLTGSQLKLRFYKEN